MSYLAMLLADARLPTGAHTQSGGLEPALLQGMARDAVPSYVSARLATVTRTEAATAVVARARWLAGATDLAGVDAAWRARTPADAARDASDQLGRGYRRLAAAVWALRLPGQTYARPVVLGAVAAVSGLDAAELARLIGYDDVQTVIAATLKLDPFDPALATRWALDAAPAVEELVAAVADLDQPEQIPAVGAPQLEGWLQWHATQDRRLFRA